MLATAKILIVPIYQQSRVYTLYSAPIIPDNCHNPHHLGWCTFFKPAYLFPQRTRKGLLLGKLTQRIKTQIYTFYVMKILDKPSQILNVRNTTSQCHSHQTKTKYPNQNTKYAKQDTKKAKQNTKYAKQNTNYAKQNTNYAKQNTKYANQNTKYAKQNTKYTKQNTKYVLIYAVLSQNNFCREFTHFGVPF